MDDDECCCPSEVSLYASADPSVEVCNDTVTTVQESTQVSTIPSIITSSCCVSRNSQTQLPGPPNPDPCNVIAPENSSKQQEQVTISSKNDCKCAKDICESGSIETIILLDIAAFIDTAKEFMTYLISACITCLSWLIKSDCSTRKAKRCVSGCGNQSKSKGSRSCQCQDRGCHTDPLQSHPSLGKGGSELDQPGLTTEMDQNRRNSKRSSKSEEQKSKSSGPRETKNSTKRSQKCCPEEDPCQPPPQVFQCYQTDVDNNIIDPVAIRERINVPGNLTDRALRDQLNESPILTMDRNQEPRRERRGSRERSGPHPEVMVDRHRTSGTRRSERRDPHIHVQDDHLTDPDEPVSDPRRRSHQRRSLPLDDNDGSPTHQTRSTHHKETGRTDSQRQRHQRRSVSQSADPNIDNDGVSGQHTRSTSSRRAQQRDGNSRERVPETLDGRSRRKQSSKSRDKSEKQVTPPPNQRSHRSSRIDSNPLPPPNLPVPTLPGPQFFVPLNNAQYPIMTHSIPRGNHTVSSSQPRSIYCNHPYNYNQFPHVIDHRTTPVYLMQCLPGQGGHQTHVVPPARALQQGSPGSVGIWEHHVIPISTISNEGSPGGGSSGYESDDERSEEEDLRPRRRSRRSRSSRNRGQRSGAPTLVESDRSISSSRSRSRRHRDRSSNDRHS